MFYCRATRHPMKTNSRVLWTNKEKGKYILVYSYGAVARGARGKVSFLIGDIRTSASLQQRKMAKSTKMYRVQRAMADNQTTNDESRTTPEPVTSKDKRRTTNVGVIYYKVTPFAASCTCKRLFRWV